MVIKSWCDLCLADGQNTPGETLTIAAGAVPAFDIELCPPHAKPLAEIVAALAPIGRKAGTGVPKTPTAPRRAAVATGDNKTSDYRDPAPGACPVCGHASPSLGALRVHLRQTHGKSLADVGLAPANHSCPECGSGFPNRQGLAAHFRISHPGLRRKEAS